MNKAKRYLFFVAGIVLSLVCSCAKLSIDNPETKYNYFYRHFEESTRGMSGLALKKEFGKLNAIKKAYQMTEFPFTPLDVIEYNNGSYQPGVEYKGMIYSSVKEIGTYVGSFVSFYTFATAVRNPRSKLYTERINETPYNGVNCRAYYGTVCSSLVSYALGVSLGSHGFVDSELMEEIHYKIPEDLEVGDILWHHQHVAMVTDIAYTLRGEVERVELCEAILEGCVRENYSREGIDVELRDRFEKTLRYKCMEDNTTYVPFPEFVPVLDETPQTTKYTTELCVDKGDCSNYLLGEMVTVNILSSYDSLVVYKDEERFKRIISGEVSGDVVLQDLPYGDYSAKLWKNNYSSQTSWMVIDYDVSFNLSTQKIHFKSSNSRPVLARLCTLYGSSGHSANELFNRPITDEEIMAGELYVPSDKIVNDRYSYVQVRFETKYGIVSTRPIKYVSKVE